MFVCARVCQHRLMLGRIQSLNPTHIHSSIHASIPPDTRAYQAEENPSPEELMRPRSFERERLRRESSGSTGSSNGGGQLQHHHHQHESGEGRPRPTSLPQSHGRRLQAPAFASSSSSSAAAAMASRHGYSRSMSAALPAASASPPRQGKKQPATNQARQSNVVSLFNHGHSLLPHCQACRPRPPPCATVTAAAALLLPRGRGGATRSTTGRMCGSRRGSTASRTRLPLTPRASCSSMR